MSNIVFKAESNPSTSALDALSAAFPSVPSYTAAYAAARRHGEARPWLLTLSDGGRCVAGCTAFLERRRLRNGLVILSCPDLPTELAPVFWQGLERFCKKQRILELSVDSFGSPSAAIPHLRGEICREERSEHVLELGQHGPTESLTRNHARNVNRACRAGVELRRGSDRDAIEMHERLVSASFRRRDERGERVPPVTPRRDIAALVEEGAAELHQAVLNGLVVSSVLVALAPEAAYYQSAGTRAEGMACGASHWLVVEIARQMGERSVPVFNLGGTRYAERGLHRFKAGFGGRVVPLERAEFVLGGRLRRKTFLALRALRRGPFAFFSKAVARVERLIVYRADPRQVPVPEGRPEWSFRKLSDADLESLAQQVPEAGADLARARREGFNGAYGLFSDRELANITWLVTAEQDKRRSTRDVKLRAGEAEITHGFTRVAFRGQGVWPYVLGRLSREAARQGVRHVLGVHEARNESSRRAIEKAGYVRQGTVLRMTFPYLLGGRSLAFRGHRRRSSSRA